MQNEAGKVVGAHCRDRISGKEFDVHAKLVINAAGPFADDVRRASDPSPLSKCERPITSRPRSTQAEIDFILNTLRSRNLFKRETLMHRLPGCACDSKGCAVRMVRNQAPAQLGQGWQHSERCARPR
eukprot:scaffold68073_cov20-Tisochrysis_lutea.AAC.1